MKKLIYLLALMAFSSAAGAYRGDAIDELDIDIVSDRGHYFETYPLRSATDTTFRAYLEAVPQEHYSIRVRNRGPERIGLVIAVDGRNIISGKKSHLRSNERLYILGPYESATYSGWRSSRNRINRFYFTEVEDSYSAAFGDYSAMGVIAVSAFREKYRYRAPQRYNKRGDNSDRESESSRSGKSKSTPQAAEKSGRAFDDAGTGYGHEEWSPSVRVEFKAERRAFARYFMKYEWRETLCEKGIANCYARNRFWNERWDDRGFAPPPPRRARWLSRWRW